MCDLVSCLEIPQVNLQHSLLFANTKSLAQFCNRVKVRRADLESGIGSVPDFNAV